MIAFDRALPGQPFALSNPQTVPVTGTLRVHPRLTGPSSTKVIAFTLAAGEQKTFADLLQDLAETKANVIRVESSDLLGDTLRPVTPGYSDASSLVYTPGGTDPTILIPALNSTFRVKIFASNTSMITAFSQEFTVNGEATLALQSSVILGDTRIPGGFVVVEPVTGAASVTTTYVPSRRRSVGHRGLAPVYFSVSTPGCAGTTGATASVTLPPAGMTYGWEVLNGTPEGSTANSLFAFTLGQKGYSAIRLTSRRDTSSTSMAAIIRVDAAPTVSSLTPHDVNANATETISWQVSSDATTGKLFGSDFPSQGLTVNLAAGRYSYTADSAGSKWVELVVGNGCGSNSKRSTYDVVAPAPSGSITGPTTVKGGQGATLTIVVENVPANVEWLLRTSNDNGFDSTTGIGSGTFTRMFLAAELGSDTVTLEVDGVVIASITIVVTVPAPSGSITAPALCAFGGPGAAITVVIENVPAGVEWKLRSAIGNGFGAESGGSSGFGSGTFTRYYAPANEPGQDTITVEVDGVVFASAQILVVGTSLDASPLTIEFGQSSTLTIKFELLPADKEWALRSTKGNTFDSTTGTGNGTSTRLYVASVATGEDTVILEVDGVYMYQVPIQVN